MTKGKPADPAVPHEYWYLLDLLKGMLGVRLLDAEPEPALGTGPVPAEPVADGGSGPSVPPARSTGKKMAHTVATLAAALEQTNATLERMKAENAQLREQHSRVVQRLSPSIGNH